MSTLHEVEAEVERGAMLRNREAKVLLKEINRLRKGIGVAQDYCSMGYCERHDNWRISGYIFGCGDQDHES